MKELSIEEKAKRYDEALKVAKSNYKTIVQMDKDCTFAKEGIVNTFHHMFPELAESEDERIRKAIIRGMYALKDQKKTCFASIPIDDVIACLEKQGGQKFADNVEPKFKVGDFVKNTNYHGEPIYEIVYIDKECYICEYRGKKNMGDKAVMHFSFDNPYLRLVQKLAWSEEDEYHQNIILYCLSNECVGKTDKENAIDWFKSLKDRIGNFDEGYKVGISAAKYNQWKPSDEQMKALKTAKDSSFDLNFKTKDILKSLYNDLKKLL